MNQDYALGERWGSGDIYGVVDNMIFSPFQRAFRRRRQLAMSFTAWGMATR